MLREIIGYTKKGIDCRQKATLVNVKLGVIYHYTLIGQ
jgi:hypothetical protein